MRVLYTYTCDSKIVTTYLQVQILIPVAFLMQARNGATSIFDESNRPAVPRTAPVFTNDLIWMANFSSSSID